jgi:hypothetical protein
MSDEKYKGRTRAEWRAMRGGPSDCTYETGAEIEGALDWFDKQGEKSRHDAEEQRFQIQFNCSVPRSFRELSPIGFRMNREGARHC